MMIKWGVSDSEKLIKIRALIEGGFNWQLMEKRGVL